jgi:hypothetical protein
MPKATSRSCNSIAPVGLPNFSNATPVSQPLDDRDKVGQQLIQAQRANLSRSASAILTPPAFAHSNDGGRSFSDPSDSFLFWSPACNPFVLAVEAWPVSSEHPNAFHALSFEHLVAVLYCQDREHILFSDGARHLQLAVVAGSVLDGPVRLHYLLSGFQGVEAKALTLNRLCYLRKHGSFPRSLYPPETRAPRYAMMLRAFDGAKAGASQREIAIALFGEKAVYRDWEAGFLRTRVQRLIRRTEQFIGGDYRRLFV